MTGETDELGQEWIPIGVGYQLACKRYFIAPAHSSRMDGEWNAWRLGRPQPTSLSLPASCYASRSSAAAACIEDAKSNPEPPGKTCEGCEP